MDGGYSLSDLAAATRGADDGAWGGNGAWWIIVLVLFMWGRGGWGIGDGCGQPVSEAGLCNAMNFNNLENAVGRLGDQQTQIAMQEQRDLCSGFSAIASQISQVATANQQCCCETQRAIDATNYNVASQASAIMQTDTANTQKILDKLCGMENQALRDRVGQLELQQQMCGVVRYPNQFVYTAGNSPFCGCGTNPCGCGVNF